MPLRDWLQLSLTNGIGPILARRIIESAGDTTQACGANASLLKQVEGIGSAKSQQIARSLAAAGAEADVEMERAAALGVRIICPEDEEYPVLLNSIPDPPLVLYVKGNLEPRDLNAVAIVGSRRCSHYGREQAERFAALLAGAGITVVSGGARGVDSAAHRGAIVHSQGRTVAVLGCGINIDYPPENAALFQQLTERGAVISEYPIDAPPAAENFPKRNRIVSGMSRGVLVIEADERSGALITARQAGVDHGRPVFALPGRIDNKMSVGPHQLIRDGATLVTSLEDILEGLGPLPQQVTDIIGSAPAPIEIQPELPIIPHTPMQFNAPQTKILDRLADDTATVDQLIDSTGLDASVILGELTFLCLKGAAKRLDGQTFTRTQRS